jgi:Flp pilus assembly protein TadB
MLENPNELIRLVAAGSAFGLVAAIWAAFSIMWAMRRASRQRSVEERLGLLTPAQGEERELRLWREGGVATTTVAGQLAPMTLAMRLRRRHYQAGLGTDIGPAMVGVIGTGIILCFGTWFLTRNYIAAGAAPILVGMAYSAWLGRRVRVLGALFEKQFVHALELAARSLRAGHPLLGAFHLISEELDKPVSTTFMEICQQHSMGVTLEAALERVAAASTSQDLRLFATSVAIQLRSGGNLADMMDRLAYVIRDRLRLGRRIRVLTSQTQFSKRVLIALPFMLFFILNIVNPNYIGELYRTTQGQVLLGVAACMMVVGIFAMNRMAILKY